MGEVIRLDDYRDTEPVDFFTALDKWWIFDTFSTVSKDTKENISNITEWTHQLSEDTFVYQWYISFIEKLFWECFGWKAEVSFCTLRGIGIQIGQKNYRIEGLVGARCNNTTLSTLIQESLWKYTVFDINIINFNHDESMIELIMRDHTQIKIPYVKNIQEYSFDSQIGF